MALLAWIVRWSLRNRPIVLLAVAIFAVLGVRAALTLPVDAVPDVTNVQVLKPLPFGLDNAAVEAVKKWKFKPGTLNGQPVDVIFNLTVNFKLN